ncbi:MAG: fibronectin type III domain-containing protein, partial [Candidatus Nanopelagicales bacterium]
QMTAVKCDVPTNEPQVFAVDNPVVSGTGATTTVTISGRDFGTQGARSAVLLGAPGDAAVDPTTAAPLQVISWSDTSITVAVPAAGNGFAPGARQLVVRSDLGAVSTTGITLHVIGGTYTPTVITVGPGKDVDTDNGGTLQQALDNAASGSQTATKLVVAYPLTPTTDNPRGDYLENVVIHSGVKLQGIGTGGFRADGSHVDGSVINGERFQEGTPQGNAWLALVSGLNYKNKDIALPDSATVTVVTPGNGNGLGSSTIKPSIDGFLITGGIQQTTPTNINILTGGSQTPYGGTGAVVTQGGGIYVHGGSDGLTVTNNRIEGNSGSYAGAIRVGTPYANGNIGVTADSLGLTDTGATPSTNYRLVNRGLVVAHNTIANNGGANLGGGIGLFSGTVGYRVAYNDVCGNFSAEYGGGISHYGFSRGARIDHNRVWFNESYDEGGGIMVAGEVPPNPDSVSGGAGDVRIDDNRIAQNLSNDDGGGIRLLNAGTRRITIENNEIVNNVSAHEGGGIALNDATDVVIDNDTIAGNITTATAVTSNGQPAAAGIATANLSSQLQALVANVDPSQPDFTDPVTFNDIIWDNRAGAFVNGLEIVGIGDADKNVWDIGSPDSSGLVEVHGSVLSSLDGTTGLGLDNTQNDPAFVKEHTVTVHADARRSFVAFRQTVITDMTVNPWNAAVSDYRIGAGSSAVNQGLTSITLQGALRTAPATDLTGLLRTAAPDSGAFELATVTPAVPAALAAPTVTGTDNHQLTFAWTAAPATNPAVTSYSLRLWSAASGGTYQGGCVLAGTTCTVTGLTNGTHYYADVVATNAVGSSLPSPRTDAVPAPKAPTVTALDPQNGGLIAHWTVPASVSPVQSFTATAYDAATGGTAVGTACTTTRSGSTAPALSCTITGLTNNTTYWVEVVADYGNGDTATSAARLSGVPNPAKPGAPTNLVVAAAPVSGGLDITWRPGSTGGVSVHYAVTAVRPITGNPAAGVPCSVDSAATTGTLTCRITGLLVGTQYRVTVTPSNVAGPGPSVSGLGTTATVPGRPTSLLVLGSAGSASVLFLAPSNGGLPITSYTVGAYLTTAATTTIPGSSCTVPAPGATLVTISCTGLPAGQRNIRIVANNAIGAGQPLSVTVNVTAAALAAARVIAPKAAAVGTLVTVWSGKPASKGVTTWIVKAYASKTSTKPVAWCVAKSSARSCVLKGLVHGRAYYVSVWRASPKAPTLRVATRIVGRAR